MIERFTVEEINLMSVFDARNRTDLIFEVSTMIEDFKTDDPLSDGEILEIAQTTLEKVSKMTDAEFDALELYPIFDDETEVND